MDDRLQSVIAKNGKLSPGKTPAVNTYKTKSKTNCNTLYLSWAVEVNSEEVMACAVVTNPHQIIRETVRNAFKLKGMYAFAYKYKPNPHFYGMV